jgi:hydrogenase-4 component F
VTDLLVAAVPALALLSAVVLALLPARLLDRADAVLSTLTATAAIALAVVALTDRGDPDGGWYVLDGATGVYLVVVAVVGLLSALASAGHLASVHARFFARGVPQRSYYVALQLFWAALIAVPLVDNLAIAWILIEATTAASALLVATSGKATALEAGWKYLVLTTLGLAVALLGIVVLYAAVPDGATTSLSRLDWAAIHAAAAGLDPDVALLAFVLILAGLASKIGWAPVHNWLPDAHSEAPPPVSALLSAALLPTVMLVAWRAQAALRSALDGTGSALFLGFGLVSLAVAVPFLWRPLPLKRLLAYSSLEHMGILALGIGFASPLATAGVVIHVAGHALAKSLGFYAAIPLLRADARLSSEPPAGLGAVDPAGATAVGISLGSLSGLPPSPLFFSEVLILAGGVAAGELAVVAVAATALALGFLGLAHALITSVAGDRPAPADPPAPVARRRHRLALLTAAVVGGLISLSVAVYALPGSQLIADLMRGVA